MRSSFHTFALLLGVPAVLSQCLYPPCPQNDEQAREDQCCAQTRQELAEVHRNMTALWYTVSEFREVVARHLHHLHQHQVQMFVHQMSGQPPPPHSLSTDQVTDPNDQRRDYRRRQRPSQHRHHDHHHHHHHHDPQQQESDPFYGLDVAPSPKAFSRPPKVRNPEDFDFAACQMNPNSAVPDSRVQGVVYLSQKKNSDTLYLHLMLSGFNTSGLPSAEHQASNEEEKVWLHGFHVHERADFSNGCDSTGPHYNPYEMPHGGPHTTIRHIGDFGNVPSDSEGAINELITDETASLRGEHSLVGKPLVIHALEDDLGSHSNDPGSTSTGNSGARLACCVIEKLTISTPSYRMPKVRVHEQEQGEQQQQDLLSHDKLHHGS